MASTNQNQEAKLVPGKHGSGFKKGTPPREQDEGEIDQGGDHDEKHSVHDHPEHRRLNGEHEKLKAVVRALALRGDAGPPMGGGLPPRAPVGPPASAPGPVAPVVPGGGLPPRRW